MSELISLPRLLVVCMLLVAAGCASVKSAKNTNDLNLLITQPAHVVFSGRGAAAGPMLMSAMGPSGIAVGVAIDIGIAKDIEKAAFGNGYDPQVLFNEAFTQLSQSNRRLHKFLIGRQAAVISVTSVGFYENPAKQNVIYPQLKLTVNRGQWSRAYNYPEDFTVGGEAPAAVTLEELKGNNSPARSLLQNALGKIYLRALADYDRDGGK